MIVFKIETWWWRWIDDEILAQTVGSPRPQDFPPQTTFPGPTFLQKLYFRIYHFCKNHISDQSFPKLPKLVTENHSASKISFAKFCIKFKSPSEVIVQRKDSIYPPANYIFLEKSFQQRKFWSCCLRWGCINNMFLSNCRSCRNCTS